MYDHHHSPQMNALSMQRLAEFDAALGDLSEDEKKRRRILYIKEALRQMQTVSDMFKKAGCLLILFVVVPIFWPVLIMYWVIRRKLASMMGVSLNAALEYWRISRHELFTQGSDPAERSGRRGWE